MKLFHKFASVLFAASSSISLAALPMSGFQTGTSMDQSVQAAVDAYAAKWGATGLSVIGGRDDEDAPRFASCYGYKSEPQYYQVGKGCTVNTLVNIGSASKQVTAKIVGRLVSDGLISLDQHVFCVPGRMRSGCVLDNITSFNGVWVVGLENVTVRHLRDHTSGIEYGCFGSGCQRTIAGIIGATKLPLSKTQIASNAVATMSVFFQPGTSIAYSNSGYFFLSMVIEKVTGKSYEVVMQEMNRQNGIRDEDFKVCSNQRTNAKWDASGKLVSLPTNGFDFRQWWKNPIWYNFNTPQVSRSDYDIFDVNVYPDTEDSENLEVTDGSAGLCATPYAYWKFAKSTNSSEIGLAANFSWLGEGSIPGAVFASYTHFDGHTYVIASNTNRKTDTESSLIDLNKVFDAVSVMSGNVMAARLSPLWNDNQLVPLKVYSLVQGDGRRRYFATTDKNEISIVESLSTFTKEEEFQVYGKQFSLGDGTRFNLCRYHFQPDGKDIAYSSHFYGNNDDCNFISRLYPDKNLIQPIYEDLAFALGSKNAAGGCNVGQRPVYRLFGAKEVNHRYTLQLSVVAAMLPQGWTNEGIVGCAPQ